MYGGLHGIDGLRNVKNRRIMEILFRLSPGTAVAVWFDSSGFRPTFFQFLRDDEAAFSGGSLDGGLTYIKADDIRALRVGHGGKDLV